MGADPRVPPEDRARWLDFIYEVPDALDSLEQRDRYHHADLARRPRAYLARERERVRLRLLLDDAADVWLVARLEKLNGVLDRAR